MRGLLNAPKGARECLFEAKEEIAEARQLEREAEERFRLQRSHREKLERIAFGLASFVAREDGTGDTGDTESVLKEYGLSIRLPCPQIVEPESVPKVIISSKEKS